MSPVGSAAGSTFARIFFKQVILLPMPSSDPKAGSLEYDPAARTAALPSQQIARFLLNTYIARIHTWWPFLSLAVLRRTFQRIYQDTSHCSDYDKFLVFVVLALASAECCESQDYLRLMDLNDSSSYFQTCLRFFATSHNHLRDLPGLQAILLLTIWMMNSTVSNHCSDLWQLSRYAMSTAVEIGIHRHNADWGFTVEELEVRNRTWWSTYALERFVQHFTEKI